MDCVGDMLTASHIYHCCYEKTNIMANGNFMEALDLCPNLPEP